MLKSVFIAIAIASCCSAYGDNIAEYAILSNASGSVYILDLSSGKAIPIKDVSCFDISHSGHFIMRDKYQGWMKGIIDSSLNITKQAIELVPGTDLHPYIAISEDGNRIAWIMNETKLVIQDYNASQAKITYSLSADGIISAPSWSPGGHWLAYYYGPPGAEVKDNYSLMLLNTDNPDSQPEVLAAPSLPIGRMNPARTNPPLWSPDGKSILFEAHYRDNEYVYGYYIVAVESKRLTASVRGNRGAWDKDGKRVISFDRVQDDKSTKTFVITETDAQEGQEGNVRFNRSLKLEGDPMLLSVSPSGDKAAYFNNKGEVVIYDSRTDQTIAFGQHSLMNAKITWITPKAQ